MQFLKLTLLLMTLVFTACSHNSKDIVVVGTIAGPESELMEVAQKVAKDQYGLVVKIVEFNDYNLPNEALQDGSLDANVYQHEPYLKEAIKAHGYTLKSIGKTFIYPTAIYSQKHKSLKGLPQNALVAIPNDPSNGARALLLLQQTGLIKLSNANNPSVQDIISNPKSFKFKELDAAQLPRIIDDVDLAIINTNFAVPAGLSPSKDGLAQEDKNSPYANIIVINEHSLKKDKLSQLVKALNSDAVAQKAKLLFGDAAMPAWNKEKSLNKALHQTE